MNQYNMDMNHDEIVYIYYILKNKCYILKDLLYIYTSFILNGIKEINHEFQEINIKL